jgi:hypothetical protein
VSVWVFLPELVGRHQLYRPTNIDADEDVLDFEFELLGREERHRAIVIDAENTRFLIALADQEI